MERGVRCAVAALALACVSWGADSPERGVARISLINGEVNVRRGDANEVIAAAVNAPLVVADRLYTGPGSRAELQFDYSNMVRLAPESEIRLADLDHKRYILQVAQGTVTYRVLRDQEADVELSTPSVSVRPVRKGIYRVTVLPDGSSEITVRSGEAEIFTPRGSERLGQGRTMYARGTQAEPEFRIANDIPFDEWDRWNERRDRDLERSRSYQYVSRDIYGAEDLDAYGRWIHDPPYGWVWAPVVSSGWAPYRLGRWSWIDYYGWTWISYDPWGWAPYHYGRWYYRPSFGWCWWPGGFAVRHYWSPALVAFFGFGRGGFGIGFGNIGWIPLAPYDRFDRWWGPRYYGGYRSRAYIDNSVNIVNNVNIRNVYRNSQVDNAITAVNTGDFGRRGVGNSVRVGRDDLERGSLVRGAIPVTPNRESLRMADRVTHDNSIASRSERNDFFSIGRASQLERVPFEDQRRGMQEITRRSFNDGATGRVVPDSVRGSDRSERVQSGADMATPMRVDDGVRGVGAGRSADRESGGWRRFGEPSEIHSGGVSQREAASERGSSREVGGWRRFGEPGAGRTAERGPTQAGWRGSDGRGWRAVGEAPSAHRESVTTGIGRGDSNGSRAFDRGSRTESQMPPAAGMDRSSRSSGWRRDLDPAPATDRGSMESSRGSIERSERRSFGRFGGFGRGGAGESIQISPPIIRERESGGFGRRGGGFGGGDRGGGEMRAPRGGDIGGGLRGERAGGGEGRGILGGGGRAEGGGASRSESTGRSGGRNRE